MGTPHAQTTNNVVITHVLRCSTTQATAEAAESSVMNWRAVSKEPANAAMAFVEQNNTAVKQRAHHFVLISPQILIIAAFVVLPVKRVSSVLSEPVSVVMVTSAEIMKTAAKTSAVISLLTHLTVVVVIFSAVPENFVQTESVSVVIYKAKAPAQFAVLKKPVVAIPHPVWQKMIPCALVGLHGVLQGSPVVSPKMKRAI